MSENITRKEFQLHIKAQEKEGLINRIKSSLGFDYGLATLFGIGTGISAWAMLDNISYDSLTSTACSGIFTLFNVGFLVYRGGVIVNKNREIGKAEAELEQIKENPEYKKLQSKEGDDLVGKVRDH